MKVAVLFISLFLLHDAVFAQHNPEGLFIHSKAPEFTVNDQNGNAVSLKELRKKGPVVIMFYEGYWNPFSRRQLKNWQDSLEMIKAKGATLVAVSPENRSAIDSTISITGATFSIISDEGMRIADAYDVAYFADEKTLSRQRNNGYDLLQINNQRKAQLPVPAVYVIDSEGDVTFRYFDTNYRNRLSVKALLQELH